MIGSTTSSGGLSQAATEQMIQSAVAAAMGAAGAAQPPAPAAEFACPFCDSAKCRGRCNDAARAKGLLAKMKRELAAKDEKAKAEAAAGK